MRRGCSSIVVIVLFIAVAAWIVTAKTPTHVYQLTIEVSTPMGPRRASVVRQIFAPCPGFVSEWSGIGPGVTLKGEAAFVDLGDGKNLIALLAGGPHADMWEAPNSLAYHAMQEAGKIKYEFIPMCDFKLKSGKASLSSQVIPTLVTFQDLNDPKSGAVVEPTAFGFSSAFGVGYALNNVSVEMMSVGIWPLNIAGLWGAPTTRVIESKIPFLMSHRAELREGRRMLSKFEAEYSMFLRE